MKKLTLFALFSFLSMGYAESLKTTYNPFTGKLDYYTAVNTTNFASGAGVTVSCTAGVCTFSASGSAASNLEAFVGPARSSPTASITGYTGDFIGSVIGGTTFQFALNPATTDFYSPLNNVTIVSSGIAFGSSTGTVKTDVATFSYNDLITKTSNVLVIVSSPSYGVFTDPDIIHMKNYNSSQLCMGMELNGDSSSFPGISLCRLGAGASSEFDVGEKSVTGGYLSALSVFPAATSPYVYVTSLDIGTSLVPSGTGSLYMTNQAIILGSTTISGAGGLGVTYNVTSGTLTVVNALSPTTLCVSTSSTAGCQLQVSSAIARAPTDYLFTVSSAAPTNTMAFGVQNNSHIISSGTTPVASSCGTNPVINGTDNAFTVTPGATATGCTITFASAFANNPVCIVGEQTMSLVNALGYTHSTTQVVITQTGAAGVNYDVVCIGQKG